MKIFKKQDFPKVWMKWLKIARLQGFALNTQGLLGALSGPQTLCREVRDSHCESTNPPLEIPAYGPDIIVAILLQCYYGCFIATLLKLFKYIVVKLFYCNVIAAASLQCCYNCLITLLL